jgi:hypothetical protein
MVGMEQLEVHSKVLKTGMLHSRVMQLLNFSTVVPCALDPSLGGKHYLVEHTATQKVAELWRL